MEPFACSRITIGSSLWRFANPARRAKNLCATFYRFGLAPTGVFPAYRTVQMRETDRIEFFANFDFAGPDGEARSTST